MTPTTPTMPTMPNDAKLCYRSLSVVKVCIIEQIDSMSVPTPAAGPAPAAPAAIQMPSMRAKASPPAPFTMAGGARILPDGTLNAPDVLLGLILILGISQAHLIPSDIHRFTDTILGRILLFTAAISMTAWKGWVLGILTAVLVLRLLMHAGRQEADVTERFSNKITEGFSSCAPVVIAGGNGTDSIKTVTANKSDGYEKHRWFVEQLFDEEPTLIETEKVRTMPVLGR